MIENILRTNPFQKSLRASWKEGIATVIVLTIADYFFIPFGLMLGASAFEIGLLVSIPPLFGSISQLFSVRLVHLIGSRLLFFIYAALIQSLIILVIASLVYLPLSDKVFIFIFLVTLFRIMGNFTSTVWGSLISDYLSENERGRYLGWRNKVTTFVAVIGMAVFGVTLQLIDSYSQKLAFTVLILIMFLSRLLSVYFISKHENIELKHSVDSDFTFMQFLKGYKRSNFVPYVFYVSLITFATNIAAPYFSVYMLNELKLSYLAYTGLHLITIIGSIVGYPIWGHHADVVGNVKVIKLTGWMIPLFPFLWILSQKMPYLMCVEFLAGFVWSGFNLCSINFIFDSVSPQKRIRCLSYVSLMNGIAIFSGALMGGFMVNKLPVLFGSAFFTLFLISTILRLSAHLLFFRRFKEVRSSVEDVSNQKLFFSVIGVKSFLGRNEQILNRPTLD